MSEGKLISGPFRATKLWNDCVRAFYDGMPVAKHWRGLKQYENCFTGKEAVDWMKDHLMHNINYGPHITREQATKLLNKFLENNVIISAKGYTSLKEKFTDGRDLYMLCSQSPLKALRTPQRPPLVTVNAKSQYNFQTPVTSKTKKLTCSVKCYDVKKSDLAENSEKLVISEATLWRDVLFERLEEVYSRLNVICDGDKTIVPKTCINGDWVRQNMINLGHHSKSSSTLETRDLPCWLLTAMMSLEKWPLSSEPNCNLPNYPGVEIDVFKIVRDYFTSMVVPMIPYELYEPIVKLFIGAEFLDIANRSPTPIRHMRHERSPKQVSQGSVEELMLDLSVQIPTTPETNSGDDRTTNDMCQNVIYDSVSRPVHTSSMQSLNLPDRSDYADYKESFLYPAAESDSIQCLSYPVRDLVSSKDDGRTTIRSLKKKSKSSHQRSQSDYILSEELETYLLPPNSCFETAFTSDSPITRVIPQKSFETIHYSLNRPKRRAASESRIPKSTNLCSRFLLENIGEKKASPFNKSLSEGDLLFAVTEEYSRQESEHNLKKINSSKSLASRVRDSLRMKKGKWDRRAKRHMPVPTNSPNCAYENDLSPGDCEYNILDAPSKSIARYSEENILENGAINYGFSQSDEDAYPTLALRRGKHSPALSMNSGDTMVYSVRSGTSSKVTTPIGCLSHSMSTNSCYHSARSDLTKASFPGSKSVDLLEDSLDLSSKVSNKGDVSLTPVLPRREPVIVHSHSPNIAFNQLINDYENVVPISKKLSSSESNLSDQWTDGSPYVAESLYAKEGMLEHYCSPPRLLTKAGNEFCTETLQLILLLLEPSRRHKLRTLLKMTRTLADNDIFQLHPEMDNRTLMVKTFCRTVFVSDRENGYDENLAVRITSFLMDSQDSLFTPPTELLVKVHQYRKLRDMEINNTFCQQVSPNTYKQQKLTGSQKFLAELLDQVVEDPNLSSKNRSKKLKEFRQHYPEIYKHRFPVTGFYEKRPRVFKKQPRGFKKLASLSMLTKTKSFRV